MNTFTKKKIKENSILYKEFTLKTFEGMLDKVVFWNSLAGNDQYDTSLIPVYLQLSREEFYNSKEFLQGWFTGDKVMQADGIADLVFTYGFFCILEREDVYYIDEYQAVNYTDSAITEMSTNLINGMWDLYNLYTLCLKMSEVMDVEAVFNAVYESNMTKYVHEAQLGDFDLDEEVRIIEGKNRYSGVDYHKVGSYYIFTAKQDVQSGVVFDKPKIVKPSTFKEVQGLEQFIY